MRSKNLFALWLVLLLAVSVTACEKKPVYATGPEYHFDTDCQAIFADGVGSYFVAESDDGYYYFNDVFLHFVEKATLQDVVVCSKPNCLHDAIDSGLVSDMEQCEAYVPLFSLGEVFYFEGDLYCITQKRDVSTPTQSGQPVLTRISLDGTSRKELWEVTWEEEMAEPYLVYNIFHRGIYYFVVEDISESGDHDSAVYAYDLHGKKAKRIFTGTRIDNLMAIGNDLYFRGYFDEVDHFARYDLSTGETTLLPDCTDVFPVGEEILLADTATAREKIFRGTVIDRDGANPQAITLPSDTTIYAVSEDYYLARDLFRMFSVADGHELTTEEWMSITDQTTVRYEDDTSFELYDRKTNEVVASIDFSEQMENIAATWFTEENLMVFDGLQGALFYAPLSVIGTDDFQWKMAECRETDYSKYP